MKPPISSLVFAAWVGSTAWAAGGLAFAQETDAVWSLPIDADGDGVSTYGDRDFVAWWLRETGESLESVLARGTVSGDVIDLSGTFRASNAGSTALEPAAGGGGALLQGGASRAMRRHPVMTDGTEPDGESQHARITPGAKFFAFSSKATKVDPAHEANGDWFQVYRTQRRSDGGVVQEMASLKGNDPAEQHCLHASISDDGSIVAFDTADALLTSDDNATLDVYARNVPGAATELISQNATSSGPGNGASDRPSVSGDGEFVAFTSFAGNIDGSIPPPQSGVTHVYRFERGVGGSGLLVNRDESGTPLGGAATAALEFNAVGRVMRREGNQVAFQAKNSGGTFIQCWVRIVAAPSFTAVVSLTPQGAFGNDNSRNPCFATRDAFIAFTSRATNLASGDTSIEDVFIDTFPEDQFFGLTNLTLPLGANGDSTRAMLATDAAFLSFTSEATNLVTGDADTNGVRDVFLAELSLTPAIDAIERVKAVDGSQGNGISETSDLADDGHVVVFESDADNLLGPGNDTNNLRDIFEWAATGLTRTFRRGDANDDGNVDISDSSFIYDYLFKGKPPPDCMDSADADDDGQIVITDGIFLQDYLFQGGPPPPAPGPNTCGPDPTGDSLVCEISICEF